MAFGLGSLIGTALGVTASGVSSLLSKNASNEGDRILAGQQGKIQDWRDQRYNEDMTQRADAQRILNMTMDRWSKRNKSIEGMRKTGMLSDEDAAQMRRERAEEYANLAGQIAANGEARKDQIDNQYMTMDKDLAMQRYANKKNQAVNIGNAGQQLAQASIGAGVAYDEGKQSDKYLDLLGKAIG